MIGHDTYYDRGEVSNSDLSWLEKQFMSFERVTDIEAAYRFGNLIDAMITEGHRCDHLRYRVDGEQFSRTEWETAQKMREAFLKDPFLAELHRRSKGQVVMSKNMEFDFNGIKFSLPVRCKWDLFTEFGWGGDIKSTTATTQAQFEQAISYFNYDRQRAWYMDIAGAEKDMLIGLSKKNHKVFKVYITRDSDFYRSGFEKYNELAFKHYYLFQNFKMPVAA